MAILWDKICDLFTMLVRPSRRKTRVSFSPSTLHREIMRHTKLTASPNPFFNFLAEVRMKAHGGEFSRPGSTMHREAVRIAKTAGRMWNAMSEEQKQPYRNIAFEQRKLKRLRGRRRRRSLITARRRKRRRNSNRNSSQHNSRYNILAAVSPELLISDTDDDGRPNVLPLGCDSSGSGGKDRGGSGSGSGDYLFKGDHKRKRPQYAMPRPLAAITEL